MAKRTAAKKRKRPAAARRVAKRKTVARAAATRARRRKAAPTTRPSKAGALARAAAGTVMSIAQRLGWAASENDPFLLLEADHRRFEALLKEGEETSSRAVKRRTQILNALIERLTLHELIEEKVLYPALEPYPETREIVLEGVEEHHVADVVVTELRRLAKDDEKWAAKFKVLKENIEHHIQEEERVMFPAARTRLSRDELDALGVKMKALKR